MLTQKYENRKISTVNDSPHIPDTINFNRK